MLTWGSLLGREKTESVLRQVALFGRKLVEKNPELMAQFMGDDKRRRPELSLDQKEYHIGIDFESSLFQTLAFWKPYLVWMRPDSSWPSLKRKTVPGIDDTRQFQMPDDLRRSESPYSALSANGSWTGEALPKSWAEVPLLYNTITQKAGAIIHMTAEKQFRHIWWPELWFHKHAEKLRVAAVEAFGEREGTAQESKEIIGGYRWYNAGPPEAKDVKYHGRDGAWLVCFQKQRHVQVLTGVPKVRHIELVDMERSVPSTCGYGLQHH